MPPPHDEVNNAPPAHMEEKVQNTLHNSWEIEKLNFRWNLVVELYHTMFLPLPTGG